MDFLFPVFSSIRWQDAVDILLNSYILFRLYVLFRGTHVFRVVYGVTLLLIFQRVSVRAGLILSSWALQGIFAVAALSIVIVFSNEIRSVLSGVKIRSFLWGFPQKNLTTPIDIVVKSTYDLARKKEGALMVFPGRSDLSDPVQGGIAWEGRLSSEMLLSIFTKESPVHDGAVIISGNTITRVGTILPLSLRKDLPKAFGTRHRAAAGLAAVSDALVIAVSEERGGVVTFKDNRHTHIPDNTTLTKVLTRHLGETAAKPGFFSGEKFEFILASLASLLLITAVWLSFTKGLKTLTTLEIPVDYVNRAPHVELLEASSNSVHLTLSGPGTLIKSIAPEQVGVKLDLEGASPGVNRLPVTPAAVSLPPGISLKGIEPETVSITLDVPVERMLPVQIDWSGKLPPGLILEKVAVTPERVRITGGSRILKGISTLYTEKIPLDAIGGRETITARISLSSPSLRASSEEVSIRLTARKRKN